MHYDDIPATGVVQPGSRVEYRQLYAGDAAPCEISAWLKPQLGDGQSLLDVNEGQPGYRQRPDAGGELPAAGGQPGGGAGRCGGGAGGAPLQ